MLENNIKDIYDALEILLVFITIIMNNIVNKAEIIIDESIKFGKKRELERQLQNADRFIITKWILLIFVTIALIFILSPTAWEILRTSNISFTNFEVSRTLYIFIFMILIYFLCVYMIYSYKLYKHRKKIVNGKEEL